MGYRPTKSDMEAARALNAKGFKHCRACGETKTLDGFSKQSKAWDGKRTQCNCCRAKAAVQYYEVNKKQIIERQAEYRATPAGKASQAKYEASPKGKAAKAKYQPSRASKRADGVVEHFVYLAELTLNETGETVAKIGSTHTPLNRRFGYRAVTARPVASISCGGQAAALNLEQYIQGRFAEHSIVPEQKFDGDKECFDVAKLDHYRNIFTCIGRGYEADQDFMFFDDREVSEAHTVEADFSGKEVAA